MKRYLILLSMALIVNLSFAQKNKPVQKNFKYASNFKTFSYLNKLQGKFDRIVDSVKISPAIQSRFNEFLANTDSEEEDCTPPPCSGIIDPWTCECEEEIKDPWADEKVTPQKGNASHFLAFPSSDGAKLMRSLEAALPKGLVANTKKQFPGYNVGAMLMRAEQYMNALSRR